MSETFAPTQTLTTIITTLKRTIFGVGHEARVETALLFAIQARLNRLLHRFNALLRRPPSIPTTEAPTTRPPSRAGDQAPKSESPTPESAKIKIPTSKNWLGKRMPSYLLNVSRYHVEHFLAQPETIALVAQTPQLARQVFRPLCRFFSLPIPLYLQLPPRVRKPRKPRPAHLRKPKPKPIKPPKPPEPTFLDYLLAKYPPIDNPPAFPSQIRKIFSR